LSVSQNSVVAFIPSPSKVSARRRRSVTVPARPQDHAHLKMSSIHAALHDYTLDTLSLNEVGDQPVCVGSSLIIPHASIGSTALHAAFLSNSGDGDVLSSLTSALAVGLVIAAAIFLYANVVYTPEIIENAQAMRQEEQAAQILALVRQLREEEEEEEGGREGTTTAANKRTNARDALEKVFGMKIQDYIEQIEGRIRSREVSSKSERVAVSDAEKELVATLRSLYL